MYKVRRRFFDLMKCLLTSAPLFPVICRMVYWSLPVIYCGASKEYNILVLDRERFWPGDLKRLADKNNLWELRSSVRGWLCSLFFSGGELGVLRHGITDSDFDQKSEAFISYINKLFVWLSSKRKIDFVLTCGYLYVQNRLIARALQSTNINFVDLNRESKQDHRTYENFKKKYRDQKVDTKFEGDALLVYNNGMKRLCLELKATESERVHVVGAPRIDMLIKKIEGSSQIRAESCNQVTIFSFREMPIGANEQDYPQGFTSLRNRGLVSLFDSVHGRIAFLAKRNPSIRFLIKTKWDGVWQDRIHDAMRTALDGANLPSNVDVLSTEVDAIDEILRSRAVVGLNSMTMIQARLAGRVVIQPTYYEIVGRYSNYLQYSDIQSEFVVANSAEEFMRAVQKYIDRPTVRCPEKQIFEEYIGPVDGDNLERFQNVLHALKERED